MHSLLVMSQDDSWSYMTAMAKMAARQYNRGCYISFENTYDVVVNLLENAAVQQQFMVVDSSPQAKDKIVVNNKTYVLPVEELFKVYLTLRELIMDNKIEYILVDSLSSLMKHHGDLPLDNMMTDLLLEVGKWAVIQR